MIKVNLSIVVIVLLCHVPELLFQHTGFYKIGTLCKCPDYVGGRCQKLINCPTVNSPYTHRDYLKKVYENCGSTYVGNSPLVCCSQNQRPQVNKSMLHDAEACSNSADEIGICIPKFSCKALYFENVKIPPKTFEICFDQEVCCILPTDEDKKNNSVSFLTKEEGCGQTFVPRRIKRIVGGETGKIGEWPWIALLGYNEGGVIYPRSAGTLISKRHVLTAAHCINSYLELVRLGEYDLITEDETVHIDVNLLEVFKHPEYDPSDHLHDIAILLLESEVTFTNLISPICLPTAADAESLSEPQARVFVSGWGKTMESGSRATIFQNIEIKIYNNSICKNLYQRQNALKSDKQFSEAIICAGDMVNGKDACTGDSGGPLMLPVQFGNGKRFVLIGLVSYSIGCGRKDVLSVNTNIMHVMPWIEKKIQEIRYK